MTFQKFLGPLTPVALSLLLVSCGDLSQSDPVAQSDTPASVQSDLQTKGFVAVSALEKDTVVLLVPNGTDLNAWQSKVWLDTAQDEGYRMQVLAVSDFLSLGTTAAAKIRSLIMPDSAFVQASDAVVAAVTQYVQGGGNLMLVYDAGILTDTGFFAPAKSRFSALAGVNYGLYDTLSDRLVGVGSIVATEQRLYSLNFPPGKSLPYTGTRTTLITQLKGAAGASRAPGTKLPDDNAISQDSGPIRYIPADRSDPGGQIRARTYTAQRPGASAEENRRSGSAPVISSLARRVPDQSAFRIGNLVDNRTEAINGLSLQVNPDEISYPNFEPLSLMTKAVPVTVAGPSASPYVVSGYNYTSLDYYSYVTTGAYNGTLLVASPNFGVVAGLRTQGLGKVLFVNTPLGYFKAIGTDSTPIHGFLNYFAGTVAGLPKLSSEAKGMGTMIYNWHVDDGDDLTADAKALLDNGKVFNRGPFSVHFTTGPDTVVAGDKLGMNLDNNPTAKALVRRIGNLGEFAGKLPVQHELGPHGGWNHDIYGLGASESNQTQFLPYLQKNFASIQTILGRPVTEYSAPQGNNPLWALSWMQTGGVLGHYYVGDVGSAAVRVYREGTMQHPGMWAFPVTPFGVSATFEEFEERGVSDTAAREWLYKLQDFVVARRTNRMFYNHPPGALAHLTGVVIPMLDRADALKSQGKFQWMTMTQQARFLTRKNQTVWKVTSNGAKVSTFTASHATSLADLTWLIPRARFAKPVVTSGSATVSTTDTTNWVVTAGAGKSLTLTAGEL